MLACNITRIYLSLVCRFRSVDEINYVREYTRATFRTAVLCKNYENTIDRNEAWLTLFEPEFPVPFISLGVLITPLSRSFHWCRMHNVHRGFVCPTSCGLRRRTQTSPRSPDTSTSTRHYKTHTSLRCSMLDRLLVVPPPLQCDESTNITW